MSSYMVQSLLATGLKPALSGRGKAGSRVKRSIEKVEIPEGRTIKMTKKKRKMLVELVSLLCAWCKKICSVSWFLFFNKFLLLLLRLSINFVYFYSLNKGRAFKMLLRSFEKTQCTSA